MKIGQCPICEKVFRFPDSRNRKYCSIECKHEGSRSTRKTGQCPICGKIFHFPKSELQEYCSRKCSDEARKGPTKTRECLTCKKVFTFPDCKDKKYCSRQCAFKGLERNKPRMCQHCQKEFYRPPSGDSAYCSMECYYQANGKVKKLISPCEYCGKEFEHRNPSEKKASKYCSMECWGKAQRKRTDRICKQCGNVFQRQPCFSRDFCSNRCSTSWHTGENHPGWIDGTRSPRGGNWDRQAAKARKRDNYTCQRCGITQKEYGRVLDVHHIIRFGNFDNYKEANQLENLISYCRHCHMTVEKENKGNSSIAD